MATAWRLANYGCSCQKLSFIRRQLSINLRCLSSQDLSEKTPECTSNKKRKRDRNAVLRTLAETVKQLQGRPPYGFFDDPFLMPKALARKQEYLKAIESGEEAALYVLKKFPGITRLRTPAPDWRTVEEEFEIKDDEDTLNYYISNDSLREAVELYEKLKGSGKQLSLLTLNKMLDLVGFYGVGNDIVMNMEGKEIDLEGSDNDSSSSSSSNESDSSSSDEEEGDQPDQGGKTEKVTSEKYVGESKWRHDNYAEMMFSQMEEKNGDTYEALILGLLKFKQRERAFDFYETMLEKGYQGSAFLYTSLISAICASPLRSHEKWTLAVKIMKNMNKEPAVEPDIGTFNSLLELAYIKGPHAPSLAVQIINEMVEIGVEPSLGSYLFVLKIFSSRGIYTSDLMLSIIKRLKEQELVLHHERDADFFNVAMATTRQHCDVKSAKALYSLALKPENARLIQQRSRAFLANYLSTLAVSEKDIDFVFQEYNHLVPSVFIPRDWNFEDIFRRLERENQAWRIPEIYKDLKTGGINIGVGLIKTILRTLMCDVPQEHAESLLMVVEDLWYLVRNTEVEAMPLMLSALVKFYVMNSKFSSARDTLSIFVEKGGEPSKDVLNFLLRSSAEKEDVEGVMTTLELLASLKLLPDAEIIEDLTSALEISDNQREYIKGLIHSRIN